jgi:hypothetical protein
MTRDIDLEHCILLMTAMADGFKGEAWSKLHSSGLIEIYEAGDS